MSPSINDLMLRYIAAAPSDAIIDALVEPYDVTTAFKVDARAAWHESQLVTTLLGGTATAMDADWADRVRAQPAARFVPMAVGLYPQMVSDFSMVTGGQVKAESWTVPAVDGEGPVALNQSAVLAWQCGDTATAVTIWTNLPDSPVRAFNLGMAALAAGQMDAAVTSLRAAAFALPTGSGWAALAALYASLAGAEY
jgi:hypothetical protein